MVDKTISIAGHRIRARCAPELEPQLDGLFALLEVSHREGMEIGNGKRVQFGWSMLTFRTQPDESLLLCQPDFHRNPFRDEVEDISDTLDIQLKQLDFVRSVGTEPADVSFQDKIVMAKGCLAVDQLYLERTSEARDGDSGWYIGTQDRSPAAELEAIYVFQLLQKRRELLYVLALPVSYMVIVDGQKVESILDPNDENVEIG